MTLIFTLDDNNGVRFCGKRQSKDSVVANEILKCTCGKMLFMKPDSVSFFGKLPDVGFSVDDFNMIDDKAVCFVEEVPSEDLMARADTVIVFRWNRVYPSLVKDRVSLDGFTKQTECSFVGNSHDKITKEVYTREKAL